MTSTRSTSRKDVTSTRRRLTQGIKRRYREATSFFFLSPQLRFDDRETFLSCYPERTRCLCLVTQSCHEWSAASSSCDGTFQGGCRSVWRGRCYVLMDWWCTAGALVKYSLNVSFVMGWSWTDDKCWLTSQLWIQIYVQHHVTRTFSCFNFPDSTHYHALYLKKSHGTIKIKYHH